jgi:hypothetical protein
MVGFTVIRGNAKTVIVRAVVLAAVVFGEIGRTQISRDAEQSPLGAARVGQQRFTAAALRVGTLRLGSLSHRSKVSSCMLPLCQAFRHSKTSAPASSRLNRVTHGAPATLPVPLCSSSAAIG